MSSPTANRGQDEAMLIIKRSVQIVFAVVPIILVAAYNFLEYKLPEMPETSDRLIFALQCHVLTFCTVLYMFKVLTFQF